MKEYQDILKELEEASDALDGAAESLKQAAQAASDAEAEYERKKNTYIIQLKAEEDGDSKIKRTDMVRTAMYRSMYHQERLQKSLTAKLWEVEKLAHKGLLAKVSALQTLAKRDDA